jgi:phosphoribosylformimino-5-aminoimidazole carboxamide ribotide isomerase
MRIIPAIDIIDGKCVRLTKGDYATKKIYNENPLEVAKEFEANGIKYLHLVDLDGAKASTIVNHRVLEQIASHTSLKIDFGGGLKSDEDLKIAFQAGASQITGGSIAVKNPALFEQWLAEYGSEKIILGADSHNRKIMTHGWQQGSELDVVEFIADYEKKGVNYVIPTDIAKDGMLEGAANSLYKEILSKNKIKLIASGGVASIEDVYQLEAIGCDGVIIGKAIYEGRISMNELQSLC